MNDSLRGRFKKISSHVYLFVLFLYVTRLAQFVAARSAKWKTLQGGRYAPAPKVKARTRAKPKVRKLPLVLSYSSKGNSEWNQRGNYPGVRKGVREGLLARALCARKPPAF